MSSASYDSDFEAWANEQAALRRAGDLAAADIEHVAEEIDSMGRLGKRERVSRLAVLLLHLLKWRYLPERRGASWEATIRTQRRRLKRHLADNPSLKPKLPEAIGDAYEDARDEAAAETGLAAATFPDACPWSVDQISDQDYWPA